MDNNNHNPFIWVLVFAILAFLVGVSVTYYQMSGKRLDISNSSQKISLLLTATDGGEVFGSGNYRIGTEVNISAKPYKGYEFKGWESTSILEQLDQNTTFQIWEDINITADFKKIEAEIEVSGKKPITIHDFEGFETSQYFEDSGKKIISIKFERADVERPKIGFLRMGLAFLMVRNFEILLNTDDLSVEFIASKIEELKKHKGVSYAVAEPITLWFRGENQIIKIHAAKGKLTSTGAFRLWGGVDIHKNSEFQTVGKLEIKVSSNNKTLLFTNLENGKIITEIQLD